MIPSKHSRVELIVRKMKKLIVPVLLMLTFLACQKSAKINPITKSKDTVVKPIYDTIPDGGAFYPYLVQDSSNHNGVDFLFNHSYSLKAVEADGDAPYFGGTSPEVIYTISSDNQAMMVNGVPYSRGMTLNLHISCRDNGPLFIKLNPNVIKIPTTIHIWCRDNYLKDSLDLRHGAHYNFTIDNSNPNTYGDKRFQIVLWSDRKN